MINYIIYGLIAIIATIIGGMSGIGGGMLIKVMLDNLGQFPAITIGVLSTITVFFMALTTTIKNKKQGFKIFTKENSFFIIGAISGGYIGSVILTNVYKFIINPIIITKIQSLILVIILISVIILEQMEIKFVIKKLPSNIILLSIFMGFISSLLNIGGGPINIAILTIVLGYNIKRATEKSLLIILFSQLVAIITLIRHTGLSTMDLSMLKVMIPGAILGASIGSKLNKIYSEKVIKISYIVVLVVLIYLNITIILE